MWVIYQKNLRLYTGHLPAALEGLPETSKESKIELDVMFFLEFNYVILEEAIW